MIKKIRDVIKELILKNQWILVFLLASVSINESFPTSYDLYTLIKDCYCFIVLFVLLFIIYKQKIKLSKLTLFLFLVETWWLLTTFINYPHDSYEIYYKTLYDIVQATSLALIVEVFIAKPNELIRGLLLNYEIAIYSYFKSFLIGELEPEKITRQLLNTLVLWIIPAVLISFLHIKINKGYLRSVLLFSVCLFITFNVWSATTVVSVCGMLGVVILGIGILKTKKTCNAKIHLSFLLLLSFLMNLFILFSFSGSEYKFPILSFFIKEILKRSTDFTERDVIWTEAIKMFLNRPIIGYGFKPSFTVIQTDGLKVFSHPHNQVLYRLCSTGIIGFLLFVLFHIELIKKIDLHDDDYYRIISVAAVFSISITYITEAYKKFYLFYLVFFLAYHFDDFVFFKDSQTHTIE